MQKSILPIQFKILKFRNVTNEHALLAQIAIGDEAAFKLLFDEYSPRLMHYICRFTKCKEVGEELVLDVFMKIWTGRELMIQVDNFNAFIFKIARNKSIDFLRSASKDPKLKELLWQEIHLSSCEKSDDPILLHEFEKKIREVIFMLSPQRQKVFNLSREEGLTHDQIARMLNISKSTVNIHLVESRKFIRLHLSKSTDISFLILFF